MNDDENRYNEKRADKIRATLKHTFQGLVHELLK
jgi:hypothetical protein